MVDRGLRAAGAFALLPFLALGVACSDGVVEPGEGVTLVAVSPEGGATDVEPGHSVRVRFDGPLADGMDDTVVLHRGDVTGPEVEGTWGFSQQRKALVFSPERPLDAGTRYTLHLPGGMRDAEGRFVDHRSHGRHMGGERVAAGDCSIHGGGHHGGSGHMRQGGHRGGERDGMGFAFETAS